MRDESDYLPCSARKSLTEFRADGTKNKVRRCWENDAAQYNKNVEPSDCELCPLREAITKKALREQGYQPPLVSEIREIKLSKAEDELLPGWLPCLDRNVVIIGGCCGHSMELRVCDSIRCFRIGSEVNRSICHECPSRRSS